MDTMGLCFKHDTAHASDEPLTLLEILAVFWLGTRAIPWISSRTLKRKYARELGLPAPSKAVLEGKRRAYYTVAKISVVALIPLSIVCRFLCSKNFRKN